MESFAYKPILAPKLSTKLWLRIFLHNTIERMQVPNGRDQVSGGVYKRPLSSCHTRCKCSLESSPNSEKGRVRYDVWSVGGWHCIWSSYRMSFNIRERGTSLFDKILVSAIKRPQWLFARRGGVEVAGWTVDRTTGFDSRLPSPRVGPLMARRLKTSSDVLVPVSG